jgi:hypothetical protein
LPNVAIPNPTNSNNINARTTNAVTNNSTNNTNITALRPATIHHTRCNVTVTPATDNEKQLIKNIVVGLLQAIQQVHPPTWIAPNNPNNLYDVKLIMKINNISDNKADAINTSKM